MFSVIWVAKIRKNLELAKKLTCKKVIHKYNYIKKYLYFCRKFRYTSKQSMELYGFGKDATEVEIVAELMGRYQRIVE